MRPVTHCKSQANIKTQLHQVHFCVTTSAIIKYQKYVCFLFYKKKRKKRNKCVLPFCRSITAITIAMETTARKIQVRPAINSFLVALFCAGSDKSNDSITILYTSYVPLTFDNFMKLIFMTLCFFLKKWLNLCAILYHLKLK